MLHVGAPKTQESIESCFKIVSSKEKKYYNFLFNNDLQLKLPIHKSTLHILKQLLRGAVINFRKFERSN